MEEQANFSDRESQQDKEANFDLTSATGSQFQPGTVYLHGTPIVSLWIEGQERLCLAQISNTLLKPYSYNEIHNRRVALGITCVQCTPVQLELLRRAGAMPVSSRRCGMITRREAERLVKSFLDEIRPPKLPETFAFELNHKCGWGCRGKFFPARYNSSRAKCIQCAFCSAFFSPNKFIFHCHRPEETGQTDAEYRHPDAANFNAWRRHLFLGDKNPSEDLIFAWEDVKAMFNGGNRKRVVKHSTRGGGSSPSGLSSANDPQDVQEDSDDSYNPPDTKMSRMSRPVVCDSRNFPINQDSFKSESRLSHQDTAFNYQSTNSSSNSRSASMMKTPLKTGQSSVWTSNCQPTNSPQFSRNFYKNMAPLQTMAHHTSPQQMIADTCSGIEAASGMKNAWPLFWARQLEMIQKCQPPPPPPGNTAVMKSQTFPAYHQTSLMNNPFLAAHLLSQKLSSTAGAVNCLSGQLEHNVAPPPFTAMQQHFQMLQATGLPTMQAANFFRTSPPDSAESSAGTAAVVMKEMEAAAFLMEQHNNQQVKDMKNHTIDSIIQNN